MGSLKSCLNAVPEKSTSSMAVLAEYLFWVLFLGVPQVCKCVSSLNDQSTSHLSTRQSHKMLPIYYNCFIWLRLFSVSQPIEFALLSMLLVKTGKMYQLSWGPASQIPFIFLLPKKPQPTTEAKKVIRLPWHYTLLQNACYIFMPFSIYFHAF